MSWSSAKMMPPGPRPTPRPMPRHNPRLDDYTMQASRNRPALAQRADCALGNFVSYAGPVCFGLHSGSIHNARCPEARRLARQREQFDRIGVVVLVLAFLVIGAAVVMSIVAQTCGLGVEC